MSAAAFVQARIGSTRLPGKVLEPIAGRSCLARVLERVAAARAVDEIVAVVPEGTADEPLRAAVRELGVRYVAGSELDVLDRFHTAAAEVGGGTLIRVTADCPFVDPELIDRALDLHLSERADYTSVATGVLPASSGLHRFPDGLDVEVFGVSALESAWREADDPFEREHVTPFIRRRPERFRLAVLEADSDLGDERWTIDHPDDLVFVRRVYERLAPLGMFGYRDVLAVLDESPELRRLNAAHRMQ